MVSSSVVDFEEVSVDVANVCRDPGLGGSLGLERLEIVLDAWRRQISFHASFFFAVDRTLRSELKRTDREHLDDLERRKQLKFGRGKGHADDLLLDRAGSVGGCVLSRDHFLDKRRVRTWDPDRVFSWVVSAEGVRIVRYLSRNTQSFDISRKAEQELAWSKGIPDLRHPVARHDWSCISATPCLTRETAANGALEVLPILERGIALCPGCGHALRDEGGRQNKVELKLRVGNATLARFSIAQGETVSFGRSTMPDTPALQELGEQGAFADIGRAHVELRLLGKRLAARPLGAHHRVWVSSWNSARRRFGREQELKEMDRFTPIDPRDVLLLGDRLEILRSGRSIAEAETLPDPEGNEKKPPASAKKRGAEGSGFCR